MTQLTATRFRMQPVVYIAAVVVYRLWFHPLAKFPGPPLFAATGMPFLYRNYVKGRFAWEVRDLHRKYGPIVRIAPNRLAVDGSVGWTDVFMHKPGKGTPEFAKQPGFFGFESEKSLIAAPTREAHRRQRRQLAHAFSEAAMHEQEPLITFYIDLFIRCLSENSRGGKPVDMVRWLNYLAFDIIGDLSLGESFGSLATSNYHPWIHNMFRGIKGSNLIRFFTEAGPLLAPLAFLDPDGLVKAYKENREFSNKKALARIDLGPEPVVSAGMVGVDGQPKMQVRRDFMTYMMRANKDGENGLTRDEMRVNADTLIAAGSETTATNLSTLFFELARPRNRHYRDAVATEVRGRFTSESEVTLLSANSNNLPLLHACIEESLRVHPPAGQVPPRISPGALINGQYVPKGVRWSLIG